MNSLFSTFILVFFLLFPPICLAASPVLVRPVTENIGANISTIIIQSSNTGRGYLTLLAGNDANCGSGSQVKAHKDNIGATAPYNGSIDLTADIPSRYTVRNLAQNTDYTICFTSESNTDQNLQEAPASANFRTKASTVFAAPEWTPVGSTGPSTSGVDYTSLAVAPDGTIYIAYRDRVNNYRLAVKKYSGTGWVPVGGLVITAETAKIESISLAFAPDGTPHVAFRENNGGPMKVMKFTKNSTGTETWIQVGTPGPSSASGTNYTSFAIDTDGVPLVSYQDHPGTVAGVAKVMKFIDNSWQPVGTKPVSAQVASYTSLAIAPDGTIYVAYADAAISGKATLMKSTGEDWSVVAPLTTNANPGLAQFFISLTTAPDGTPYMAYTDAAHNGRISVVKFDKNNNDLPRSFVGSTSISNPSIVLDSLVIAPDGTPYLVYQDGVGISTNVKVVKYSLGAWTSVGSDINGTFPSIAIAPNGNPYVAFIDIKGPAAVMKLNNASTITVNTDLTPASIGQAVNFTATVTPPTATGIVTFKNGALDLGTVEITGGVAVYSTTTLPVGAHTISAIYAGDGDYSLSTSPAITQTVNKADTTIGITADISPSAYRRLITFTVSVTPAPTGTITFKDGTTTMGVASLSGGFASFSTSDLDTGTHTITAVFAGDSSYNGSTSPAITQIVNKSETSVTVHTDVTPATYGQPISFTANFTAVNSGVATFMDGTNVLGTAPISAGIATFSSSVFAIGNHNITVVYAGDGHYNGSTSTPLIQVVTKANSTTTVVSSANPSTYGQMATFTATVSPVVTGTIALKDGSVVIGTATLSAGIATFSISGMSADVHEITAIYSGDSNYNGSVSLSIRQTVDKTNTTSAIVSSVSHTFHGQPVTFTATISPVATGSVIFKDGATTLGTVTLTDGVGVFNTSSLGAGTHDVTVSYSGDGNYGSSMSSALIQTVQLRGDINGDTAVNVFDALLTLQYAVGLIEHNSDSDAKYKLFADVAPLDSVGKPNGDGSVNVFDALAILRHAVGLDGW